MKYKEIESKYRADGISLTAFINFVEERKPLKSLIASGYDHFYHNSKNDAAFCRHRIGPDSNQLTFKVKTDAVNNYIRTERNIDLTRRMSQEDVSGLCSEFGYEYTNSIFKNCFVYSFDYYTLVYYICYDTDLVELGRFIEIEMKEDYAWTCETEAWESLTALERLCKPLGILAQSRVKKSLFELFGKKR